MLLFADPADDPGAWRGASFEGLRVHGGVHTGETGGWGWGTVD